MDFWAGYLDEFSECIRVKVNEVSRSYPNNPHNPLPRLDFQPGDFAVSCFIDNNQVQTCRPGTGPVVDILNGLNRRRPLADLIQQSFYNGWASKHGIKFETRDAPNGMTMNAFGPASLRHNDLWITLRYLQEHL
jgi:hypothetical protein